jgi:hypothetical protein
LTTLTVAVVTSLAIATVAWGAPGGAPGKPGGGGGPKGRVEVSIDANLIWAHEVGDTIFYTFGVTNDSGETVTVTDEKTRLDDTVPADGELKTFEGSYSLTPGDMGTKNFTNTVTATWPNGKTHATATVEVTEYGLCDDDGDGIFQTDASVCIWKPGPGTWTISVMPDSTRRTRVRITVRDHVPGNWCPQGVTEDWRRGDGPVQATVTIPSLPDPWLGDPVCPIGGYEGGEFFDVGTPSSFYLDTNGHVIITPA